jgi:hypothetical protein
MKFFLRPPWLCGGGAYSRQQPEPLARRPAPVIVVRCARAAWDLRDRRDRSGRREQARPCRPLRDRAVTAVAGVIAVIAVIAAGIVLSSPGPVRAARTVTKGPHLR